MDLEKPPGRNGHICVSSKTKMILWGGYSESLTYSRHLQNTYFKGSEIWVYGFISEKWHYKNSDGAFHPPGMSGSTAVTVDDSLYLYGGYWDEGGCSNNLFKLTNFKWTSLFPSGTLPIPADKLTSWEYNGNMYIFGGFALADYQDFDSYSGFEFLPSAMVHRGWSNQYFMYDTIKNQWTKPAYTGVLPNARASHACTKMKDAVYIFGGRHGATRMNDLYCLNMLTMKWNCIVPVSAVIPRGRSWHSFTALNERYIILYGGFSQNEEALSDCWRYDTIANIWQPIVLPSHEARLWHCACLNVHDQVLIYGGSISNILDNNRIAEEATELLVITTSPKSLFWLCIDKVFQFPNLQDCYTFLPHILRFFLSLKEK